MTSYLPSERRQNVRVQIKVSMQLVVFDTGTAGILRADELIRLRKGIIQDISLTGMCIATNTISDRWIFNMLSGTIQMALKFRLKESANPINVAARVMWVTKEKGNNKVLGLKFEDINESDRVQIMQFIIAHKSKRKNKNQAP